ncbi:MAG TPA: lipid-A-disaccharide synthase N-terminal domain-containing protein [Gammaproteobacteria bacterium]|nr:lipid-A-disaccharide synthase N-terminal domain-containing protein [Gammaproteobacteria bacterium]
MTEIGTAWFWLGLGFLGQALFGARFLVQWLYSEYHRRSVFPVVFWYISVVAGLILLVYAIHRGDIVFSVGEAITVAICARNLYLCRRGLAAGDDGRDD